MSDPAHRERLERIQRGFANAVPLNRALGLEVVDFGPASLTMRLPYDPRFVGNPDTGVLHGGVITATMDATCGAAVFLGLREPRRIATLDLRIDYLNPTTPGEDLVFFGECYRFTSQIAFTRGIAYHRDPSELVATSAGTFIIIQGGESTLARKIKHD